MTSRVWKYPLSAASALLICALLYHHWQIISAPVPLDLYEGTMPLITGIIAEGNNPYTRAFQPQAADVYPPLYNLMVAPLTGIFGNTFFLHRSVAAAFIVLACVMLGAAALRDHGSRSLAFATGAMLYAALLFYGTPVSSTNAPGVAVFLASVLVPWWRSYSNGSLIVAAMCGVLAFYTKQYFILGMAMLCLYLFLYVSMRRALLLGFAYAGALLTSVIMVHITSPYYLDNTLFAPSAALQGLQSWDILFIQLRHFLWIYAGLLAVSIIVLSQAWLNTERAAIIAAWRHHLRPVKPLRWDGPALRGPCDFFSFCLLWASLVIILYLGRNPGNYLTYLFQLISPFALLVGFRAIKRLSPPLLLAALLSLFSVFQSWHILHKDFSTNLEDWQRMEARISEADEILATQMLVMSLLQAGKPVAQDGHTFYFPLAVHKPDFMRKTDPQARVDAVWTDFIEHLYRKIQNREYDLVLISPWEMRGIFERNPPPFGSLDGRAFLKRHYRKTDTIPLSMTHRHGGGTYDVQIWEPKRAKNDDL